MDLALTLEIDDENPTRGDLRIVNGQPVLTSGSEAVAQRILIRLRWFLGEYFMDQRLGVPWFQVIFEKGTSDQLIESIIRRTILTTAGVVSVEQLSLERDRPGRSISMDALVRIDTGEALTFRELDLFADMLEGE